jgi:hypothetical protein
MGLDVNAGFIKPKPTIQQQGNNVVDLAEHRDTVYEDAETPYYWRKHARLQQFMMQLDDARNSISAEQRDLDGIMGSFNGYIFLEEGDIIKLQQLIENDNLPFCHDSFFWGHQFQEEQMKDYKEQDLDFCKDALIWLKKGYQVVYICSW